MTAPVQRRLAQRARTPGQWFAKALLALFGSMGVLAQAGDVATDKAALEALYEATDGDQWTVGTNWKTEESLSTWHGVTVDEDGRVTSVLLSNNGLSGTIPAAIGDLDKLERLDLSSNALTGTVPSELELLTNIEELRLNVSRALTGPLPSGLSNLSNLATVWISDTELCAPNAAGFRAWLKTISFSGLICPPAAQSVIDVAVFYTPSAREVAGGTEEIAARIDLLVAETNQAYQQGGVNQRLSLVAVGEVDYTQTSSVLKDLLRLTDTSDGHMDEVHAIRDQYAADAVLLMRSGSGANAHLMRTVSTDFAGKAFANVRLDSLAFAHELGHLMGLHHDRHQECSGAGCSASSFHYAYGYVNLRAFDQNAPESARWRSVMAYNARCDAAGFFCKWLLRFSNPDQVYPDPGGDPLGKSGLEPSSSTDGPSDAVRALNRTRGYVEEFRRAPDITVSFGADEYTATEGGASASVTVRLSEAPTRSVFVPLVSKGASGGSEYDFEVANRVRFTARQTERTVRVTAVNDDVDEEDEAVTLTFGQQLPAGVTLGGTSQTTVLLVDNDTVLAPPSITSVALTSTPKPKRAYAATDVIEATVRFDKSVVVTGTPRLALTIGNDTRQALHQSTAGDVMRFAYAVADGDVTDVGVSIPANALDLDGGSIRDGSSQAANLVHVPVAADSAHQVDGVKPALTAVAVDADMLRLTFDEALDSMSAPVAGGTAGPIRVTVADEPREVLNVAVDGHDVRVELDPQVIHGDAVTVRYTPGSQPIRDLVGNDAAAFSDRAATNETAMAHYDVDGDGLIGITNLQQLNAIRHDLDGNGVPENDGSSVYRAAFPDAFPDADARLRCGGRGCVGYELLADLNFDTDGSGGATAGDAYWNGGAGWLPIGSFSNAFRATIEGNGNKVHNLFVNRPSTNYVGLFGALGRVSPSPGSRAGRVSGVGAVDVDVQGHDHTGGLVGHNFGVVALSYATGRVAGGQWVGGLIGYNGNETIASYANAIVSGESDVGGLVGYNWNSITASYATGRVSATVTDPRIGGLTAHNNNKVVNSYATARVSGRSSQIGGLVGYGPGATISNSYWDSSTSGQTSGGLGSPRSTADLQAPTGYAGIYQDWNVDTDGDGSNDDPWHFGGSVSYPALKADLDGGGTTTWEEFGYQLRDGPALTTESESGRVKLTWTAADLSFWDPMPTVTYTVLRNDGTSVTALASGLDVLTYTDSGVTTGNQYHYQVAAHVSGGSAASSAIKEVTVISADLTAPTIKSITSGATHPTKDPFTVTIAFTEAVTDLIADEITVANGTGSNFSGSGSTYRLRVTPDADFDGDVTVSVAAEAAKDGASNLSEAGSATFAVDTVAPALAAARGASVNGSTLTLTFDEVLGAAAVPASAFAVTGATSRSISSVSVDGTTVELTLSVPVLYGETGVQIDYVPPSGNAIVDEAGNKAARLTDQAVTNNTRSTTLSTAVRMTMNHAEVAEAGPAKTVVLTGTLDGAPRSSATEVTVAVGAGTDSALEGTDYATVEDLTLTIPAYAISATASFTLTPANDRIDEADETLTVSGSTSATGLTVTPAGGLAIGITDNDATPSLQLSVSATRIDEDGGSATVTVSTGSGSTFETDRTVLLEVAGTATERADYTISGTALTLPAGVGTNASTVTATVTGVDDGVDDDDETVEITGSQGGVGFGSKRTIVIEDDDVPPVTVSFRETAYRVAEGASIDVPVTLSAVPERQVTVAIEVAGQGGAEAVDYSISPSSVVFGANETAKTMRVSAANDSPVDPGRASP